MLLQLRVLIAYDQDDSPILSSLAYVVCIVVFAVRFNAPGFFGDGGIEQSQTHRIRRADWEASAAQGAFEILLEQGRVSA